jgi:hypothetical protein
MDNPAGRSLMGLVRKMNELGQRAKADKPEVEDYLREISSDPLTSWFTELLDEKNRELAGEKEQSDRLAVALRAWYAAKAARSCAESTDEAESRLTDVLHEMRIINP